MNRVAGFRRSLWTSWPALLLLIPRPAAAGGELQLFYPSATPQSIIGTPLADAAGQLVFRAGLWTVAATSLLRTEISGTSVPLGDVVSERYDAHLLLGGAFLGRLEVGLDLPATLYEGGLNTSVVRAVVGKQRLTARGLDDIRLTLKGTALQEGSARPAVAGVVELVAPTGNPASFFGEPSWVVAPGLAVSKKIGRTAVASELGFRYRRAPMKLLGVDIGNELFARLAARYDLPHLGGPTEWRLWISTYGHTAAGDPFGLAKGNHAAFRNSMEVLAGAERRINTRIGGFHVTFGAGAGITPGYGAAEVRGILGFDYIDLEPDGDNDGDGIPNGIDQCPFAAEDFDEFEDEDGCPDLDNDHDGIPDEDDECPNVPEDIDGYEDHDGCPEGGDPALREQPIAPPVATDACAPGGSGGAGCAQKPVAPALAKLGRTQIELTRPIDFVGGGLKLTEDAGVVLDQAVVILMDNPKLHVRVTVTPTKATPAMKRLANHRAMTIVKYLVARGAEPGRVSGVGLDRPRANGIEIRLMIVSGGR